jgi:tetratricopeptide (TPR) repeat protein
MGSPFTQPTSYVDESIKYYKQAIELDPGFSNAYVGLGQCYWTLAHFSRDYDPVYWDSSKLSLQQAIKLDPNNGWAYSELGVVQHNWDWDKQAAINSFQTAVKLSPSDANVHNNLYYFYLRTGNCEEAEVEASTAYALWNSDYDPELDFQLMQCRGDLEQISRFKNPGLVILMFQEKYQEVVNRVTGSDSVGPLKVVLGEALALSGDSLGAVNKIKELEQLSMTSYLPTIAFAPIYMALGDREKAFEMLEKGLKERDYRIHFAHTQSISLFKAKGDPRYQSIIKRSWIPKE